MTHNSIAYYEAKLNEGRNLEQARHNREQEANERRAQDITKAYNDFYLQIADFREKEQQRHNLAAERLSAANNYLTSLQISNESRRIAESEKHNRISERNDLLSMMMHNTQEKRKAEENERHNKTMEALQSQDLQWQKTKDKWNIGFQGLQTLSKLQDSASKRIDTYFRGINSLINIYSN